MKLTKNQSKQLRYLCGRVDYNQPCARKYTGIPGGKIREIGKFKYIETGNGLESLEYEGRPVDLSLYSIEEILSALENDAAFRLCDNTPEQCEEIPADIKDATVESATLKAEVALQAKAEVHPVEIQATVESDGWMDGDGNDPAGINPGIADTPDLLDETKRAPAKENAMKEPAPDAMPENEPHEEPAENTAPGAPMDEDTLREIAMTAAAREAARLCGVISGPPGDTSVDIIRRNATVPEFLDIYGKCLRKAGNPRTLEEVANAFPAQKALILKEGGPYKKENL